MNNTTNSWEEKWKALKDKWQHHVPNHHIEDFIRTLLHDTEIATREEGRIIERKANIDTAFNVANATHEVILEKELAEAKKERLEECIAIINGRWNAQSEMKNDILTALRELDK
jgi:hypothetical protein